MERTGDPTSGAGGVEASFSFSSTPSLAPFYSISRHSHVLRIPFFLRMSKVPRCRTYTLANIWWESFDRSRSICTCNYTCRRHIYTKPEGKDKSTFSITSNNRHEISRGLDTNTKLKIGKTDSAELFQVQHCDLHHQNVEDKELASLVTYLMIDTETTGFKRGVARIIEIALRDLRGGRNSTFQTLINPECHVPNAHVHGITNKMVNRPDVPRMKDLIPILLGYVKSRQKPGGCVVFVAHNGRSFDVPFLKDEFTRCSYEIPSDWLFLDTLPLAREAMKSEGSKLSSRISLEALRDHYRIPEAGSAHRAMADVNILSLVFQKLTFILELSTPRIIRRTFKASDLGSVPKKKNDSG